MRPEPQGSSPGPTWILGFLKVSTGYLASTRVETDMAAFLPSCSSSVSLRVELTHGSVAFPSALLPTVSTHLPRVCAHHKVKVKLKEQACIQARCLAGCEHWPLVRQFLHLENGPNHGRGREMVEVKPLARKGACPRSPAALKLLHQYGLQASKVEENWAYCHVPPWVGWWYCCR